MPAGIGYSSMDALRPAAAAGPGGSGRVQGMGPQEAVRIFNLRVPERVSPTSIAPLPLLQSKGSAAPGAGGLDSMVAALMQAFKGTQSQVAPVAPLSPGVPTAPHVPSLGSDAPSEPVFGKPQDPQRPRPTTVYPIPDLGNDSRGTPVDFRAPTNPPPPRITPGDPTPPPQAIPDNPPSTPERPDAPPFEVLPEPEPPSLFEESPAPFNWHEIKRGLFDDFGDVQGLF